MLRITPTLASRWLILGGVSIIALAIVASVYAARVEADPAWELTGSGERLPDGSCLVDAEVELRDGERHSPRYLKMTFDEDCTPQVQEMTEAEYKSLPQGSADTEGEGASGAEATAPTDSSGASSGAAPGSIRFLSVGTAAVHLIYNELEAPATHVQAATSPAVCVAITTLRDPLGVPETETRNKQTWSFNGTDVTQASTVVSGHGLGAPTWTNYDNSASYGGQTVPASAIQAFGYSKFHWNHGLYDHTLYADSVAHGDGVCNGTNHAVTGTVPGMGSFITMDHHLE